MPVYEYKCTKCGHRFSLLEGLGEKSGKKKCPSCGCEETNKVFSTFSSLRNFIESAGCNPGG